MLVRWHMQFRDRTWRKTRLPRVLPGFPPEASAAWTLCGKDEADSELSMDAQNRRFDYENVKHLQKVFLSLVPFMRQASGPNLESNTAAIAEVVQMLDSWKQALDSNTYINMRSTQQRQFRHDSRVLLECIRLAKHLSGGSDSLYEVVQRCISMAVPPAFRDTFAKVCGQAMDSGPSATLVRHYELTLDVALLLLQKKRQGNL